MMRSKLFLVAILGCLFSSHLAGVSAGADVLAMQFDWASNYCNYADEEGACVNSKPMRIFTTDAMIGYDSSGRELSVDANYCPDASKETWDQDSIPEATLDVMLCVYVNSDGSNQQLWDEYVWQVAGKCLGMTVSDYFTTFMDGYKNYGSKLNQILYDSKYAPPSISATDFKTAIASALGSTPVIECNDDATRVEHVTLCLDPTSKKLVDCPSYLQKPECLTTLTLADGDIDPSPECAKYTPYTYKGLLAAATPPPGAIFTPPAPVAPDADVVVPKNTPPSPGNTPVPPSPEKESDSSSSSSSSTGIIIGAVVGVVVLVALVAAMILLMIKNKRRNEENAAYPPVAAAAGGGAGFAAVNRSRNASAANSQLDWATSPPMGGLPVMTTYNPGVPSYPVAFNPSSPSNTSGGNTPNAFTVSRMSQRSVMDPNADPLLSYVNSHMPSISGRSDRSNLSSWELDFQEMQVIQPIGEGSWGRVYLAKWHETDVAVKVLLDTAAQSRITDSNTAAAALSQANPVLARLQQEAGLLASLHHPNTVQFLGICTFPAAIVTEYCSRGSLYEVLRQGAAEAAKANELTWERRISMLMDAVKGMLYLHERSPPIVHRDLKSPNLLVTSSWTVKIADFNLSKLLADSTKSTSMAAMNPRWLAPEILNGQSATPAADVFAMGVIMWEFLTWQLPYGTQNPWSIVTGVLNGQRLPIPDRNSMLGPNSGRFAGLDDYIALMNQMWAQEAFARPNFQEVIVKLREIAAKV